MEPSAFEIALFTGVLSIGGTLLGAIVGYFLSSKIAKTQAIHAETLAAKNAQRIAGAKLQAAFAPEIGHVELMKDTFAVDSALKAALHKHATAIEEYRWFVPPESQEAYQEAWEKYREPLEGDDIFSEYVRDGGELFIERVWAILKFTEPI